MQSDGGRVRRGTLPWTPASIWWYDAIYSALQAGWYQEIDFFNPLIPLHGGDSVCFAGRWRDPGHWVLSSNASRIASLLCQNALSKRSPFRVWTREMVDTFGERGKCCRL